MSEAHLTGDFTVALDFVFDAVPAWLDDPPEKVRGLPNARAAPAPSRTTPALGWSHSPDTAR